MAAQIDTLQFTGPAGRIDCALDWPAGSPQGWALVLHPHPLHGGTRDNKVVTTIARACVEHGLLVVRPNFRGVGASEGEFDKGRGETEDMLALLPQFVQQFPQVAALPWVGAGFSFGTAVAARLYAQLAAQPTAVVPAGLPQTLMLVGTAAQRFSEGDITLPADTLLVHGEIDEVVGLDELMEFARQHELPVSVIPDASHFFHGKLLVLRSLVSQRLAALGFAASSAR